MAAVARANGSDSVLSPDGTGRKCAYPININTGRAGQSKVFVEGIAACVEGDVIMPHPRRGCELDEQTISQFSSKVFAAGRGIARIGDMYGDNIITSGSFKVFAA